MPRRKFIDRKNATTFSLVHRAQNDPLIHDENAPSMVFAEKASQQPRRPTEDDYVYSSPGSSVVSAFKSKKTKQRGDLEDEFGLSFKANEGQAAEHGVFFDDTEYDYMQHMRDLGAGEGPVTWVEASSGSQQQQKGKGKQRLEDALRELDVGSESGSKRVGAATESVGTQDSSAARSLLPEEILPSEFVKKRSYQDQQDVPDEIAGFQPDMDPDLREVLEALEDEAFVDEDQDFFAELTSDGYEIEKGEYERLAEQGMFEEGEGMLEDDDEGWESDDTIKATSPPPAPATLQLPQDGEQVKPPEDAQAQPPADPTEGAWIDEFKKFKSATKAEQAAAATPHAKVPPPAAPSALESSALSSLASGRRKKRKGAKTATTGTSMSSSALSRTDHQTLLDSRFEKIEEEYAAEEAGDNDLDDTASVLSGVSAATGQSHASNASNMSSYSRASDVEAPQLQRGDFDKIMDDFLGGYSKSGKMGRRVKRGGPQTGMQQLDEIRSGLGPARRTKAS